MCGLWDSVKLLLDGDCKHHFLYSISKDADYSIAREVQLLTVAQQQAFEYRVHKKSFPQPNCASARLYMDRISFECRYIPPGGSLPIATTIGSPNFGYRSLQRDLECQFFMVTTNLELQKVSRILMRPVPFFWFIHQRGVYWGSQYVVQYAWSWCRNGLCVSQGRRGLPPFFQRLIHNFDQHHCLISFMTWRQGILYMCKCQQTV